MYFTKRSHHLCLYAYKHKFHLPILPLISRGAAVLLNRVVQTSSSPQVTVSFTRCTFSNNAVADVMSDQYGGGAVMLMDADVASTTAG